MVEIYIKNVMMVMYIQEVITVPKVRTQIYLTEEQHQMLRDLSDRKKTPVAEMIRQAVDEYLNKQSSEEPFNPLNRIIAMGESGSSRGSVTHDEEIYGD